MQILRFLTMAIPQRRQTPLTDHSFAHLGPAASNKARLGWTRTAMYYQTGSFTTKRRWCGYGN